MPAGGPIRDRREILRPRRLGRRPGPEAAAHPRAEHAPLRGDLPGPRRAPPPLLALWQQIAEHYQSYPPTLVFELLNEPHDKLTADKWNPILAEAIQTCGGPIPPARSSSARPAGTASTTSTSWCCPRRPPPDRHGPLLQSVPLHAPGRGVGQHCSAGRHPLDGHAPERQAILRDLDKALAWPWPIAARSTWASSAPRQGRHGLAFQLDAVRGRLGPGAEDGFAYWGFCSGFGVYDPQRMPGSSH